MPGTSPALLFEQLAEDRNESRRKRRVGDERPHQVRYLEGDRERVDLAASAEVVGGDDLAQQAQKPREPGGE